MEKENVEEMNVCVYRKGIISQELLNTDLAETRCRVRMTVRKRL